MKNIELLNKLSDDKNKFERLIVFVSLLIIQIVFGFWIARLFGYYYNGQDINLNNIIMFFSTYEILIPLICFLVTYVSFNTIMPIPFSLWYIKRFSKILDDDNEFRRILKELGIIGGELKTYEFLKENYGSLITKKGQQNLFDCFTLLFCLCLVLLILSIFLSFWFLIPFILLSVYTYFFLWGTWLVKTIYIRKKDIEAIMKEEANKIN